MTSVLTPEVLALIEKSVSEAPEFTAEQARRLRAIWGPAAQKCARRMQPAGELITKGS